MIKLLTTIGLKLLHTEIAKEVIITVLVHIAAKTENTLDDEIIEAIRRIV